MLMLVTPGTFLPFGKPAVSEGTAGFPFGLPGFLFEAEMLVGIGCSTIAHYVQPRSQMPGLLNRRQTGRTILRGPDVTAQT